MRLDHIVTLTFLLSATSALAGHNCKCQDANGQYNGLTNECCGENGQGACIRYYPGPNNQCTSPTNCIDSGQFVQCCQRYGVGGAYCWD
ncbi:hypothetical protein BOTBODRAFT_36526 [Botryobasidium botryosum FD-172 SS1]|uniref:Uncharacterized protein n=1 Tax=Botryobasidium botryosum (strain FD-172 SS1) TaxID=930990 RepID=A0A067MES6_BOTB1|nr:hypothetical protein BOTBODRAFT_36526 [Botryobasidium botryosum FD-172 SS1]